MFSKILIANRGEIACRIIKTAKRMGIKTVAVFSDADADALHVEMADESVNIGPAPASQSYLVIDKIIAACKATGAEAVHPGYGFLSERAAFAEALKGAGITFIGPNIHAIEAMGDKIESKKTAAKASVTTVPGYMGIIENEQQAQEIAQQIGYPVMIKASAGGGGKGMRVAANAEEVKEGFLRARSEAKSSFGDDRVFIEKFIVDPRHIEIQVLGDKHGNVIYLGERECSIQRRNQKVLEEAPSPLLDFQTRKRMGEQAVALAKAVGYDSAGTVEFVVDQNRNFYFLEMNTRLQVEHPVTEFLTGLDLVEQMIRVAAGEKLALTQNDIVLNGWAIEARVCAEDPRRNFMPSTGRITVYQPPIEGTDGVISVRVDTGVSEGGEISVYYDPLVAKVITHAPTRELAVEAMSQALNTFVLEGIQHNVPFLSTLMAHPRWQSGKLSTAFLAEEFPQGFEGANIDSKTEFGLAAVALHAHLFDLSRRTNFSGRLPTWGGFLSPTYHVLMGESEYAFNIGSFSLPPNGQLTVTGRDVKAGSAEQSVELFSEWLPTQRVWQGIVNSEPMTVQIKRFHTRIQVSYRGASRLAYILRPPVAALFKYMPKAEALGVSKDFACPMPGLVMSLNVKEGQEVKAGDIVAVVEAMKMENVLRSERDGIVKAVKVKVGESVAADAVMFEYA